MKAAAVFTALRISVNLLLAASLVLLLYGLGWEYSTRNYLEGFADAIVLQTASPEEKVEAILAWLEHGPERRGAKSEEPLASRDPVYTLNQKELLRVCGTATNAFLNLASSSGLEARRLILLDSRGGAKHVVAEVRLEGQWIVVDPAYHTLLRDAQGRPLTKEQLRSPDVYRAAAERIPGYSPNYTYEQTAHIRLQKLPFGLQLRRMLDRWAPGWEEAMNWSLLLERPSFALVSSMGALLLGSLLARLGLGWYGRKRLK